MSCQKTFEKNNGVKEIKNDLLGKVKMENKELKHNAAFQKMQKEKDDANMRYIAQRIDDLYYNQIDQDAEIPDELDQRMLEFCRRLDGQKERERKKKKIYLVARRCAVFLLCFGIIGGISISSVDAWKARFTNWLFNIEEDHVEISPTDMSQLNGWHNYYFFSKIPEGYELKEAEDWEVFKEIFFANDEKFLTLSQYDASSQVFLDIDTSEYKELMIGGSLLRIVKMKNVVVSRCYCLRGNGLLRSTVKGTKPLHMIK